MIVGIFLIGAGIMIALYPPLLSIVVASLLIVAGISLALVSYHFKKMNRNYSDPFTNFFMKF